VAAQRYNKIRECLPLFTAYLLKIDRNAIGLLLL
jgi:hypothetical protein